MVKETGIDVYGNPVVHTTYKSMPQFKGIKLKDGTIQEISAGSSEGYIDESSNIYQSIQNIQGVLDIDESDSLLFLKSQPENNQPFTEENYYVVPLN